MSQLNVRKMVSADVTRADELMMRAYGASSRRAELDLYLSAEPLGWFVMEIDDRLIAAGGALNYGRFAWIGLVATDPDLRNQGLGRRMSVHILGWCQERGCATIALDASDLGRPIYERLGFVACGATVELGPHTFTHRAARAAPALDDIDELVEFDRDIFGADRAGLLRRLFGAGTPAVAVHSEGALAGYLFVGKRILGPGAANDGDVLDALVKGGYRDGGGQHLLVPAGSSHGERLKSLGLREERRLTHMRLGEQVLPGMRSLLFAQTSYAAG